MNTFSKNNVLTWLVVLLLIANAISITLFWIGNKKQAPAPPEPPQEFLVKQLQLDASQLKALGILVQQHQEAANQLREKTRAAKEAFFALLQQPVVSDSLKLAAAKKVSNYTEALDLMTFEHFQKVRALCTPGQQTKFDSIIREVTSLIGPPPPPAPPTGPSEKIPPPPPPAN
jgi:hypothetical protein